MLPGYLNNITLRFNILYQKCNQAIGCESYSGSIIPLRNGAYERTWIRKNGFFPKCFDLLSSTLVVYEMHQTRNNPLCLSQNILCRNKLFSLGPGNYYATYHLKAYIVSSNTSYWFQNIESVLLQRPYFLQTSQFLGCFLPTKSIVISYCCAVRITDGYLSKP